MKDTAEPYSVILDGKLVRSCIVKMKKLEDGANVTTVEGVGTPQNLHPIQKAMVFHGAAQCGFCANHAWSAPYRRYGSPKSEFASVYPFFKSVAPATFQIDRPKVLACGSLLHP